MESPGQTIPTMGGDVVRCLSGFPVVGRDGRCAGPGCGPCWSGATHSPGRRSPNASAGESGLPEANVALPCERCGRPLSAKQEKYCSFGDGGRSTCAQLAWKEKHPYVTPTHIRQRESGSIASSLLEVLRNADDFLTVQQLAEAVGALPASVSARIRELRAKGHAIRRDQLRGSSAVAHRYRLVVPETAA